jgi:hypothetical protein
MVLAVDGHSVDIAEDGKQAHAMFEGGTYDFLNQVLASAAHGEGQPPFSRHALCYPQTGCGLGKQSF